MLKYLLFTMLIEIPIYFIFDRKNYAYSILILILANCFTWPILNLLFQYTTIHLLVLESFVTIAEAIILYLFLDQKISKAILISFIQNVITTFIGVWIHDIKL